MDLLQASPDEFQRAAREYLAEAQKTGDLVLRNELLKLCEKSLQEAAAARQAVAAENKHHSLRADRVIE
jgi:hypothetical protein